jgi:hypothetical protein
MGALLAAWLVMVPAAAAQKPLRKELAEVASRLHRHLRVRSTTVAVGSFTCDTKPPTNHGPGIHLILAEELRRCGLRLDRESRWLVEGSYKAIIDTTTADRHPALKLTINLHERDGDGGFDLTIARAVVDEETVAGALGLTVSLPPGASGKERAKDLADSIRNDRAPTLAGSRVSTNKESPYAVEVLVKRGGKYVPVMPEVEDSVAYAPIARHETYAVCLYNDTDHEAAASLTIDGIDLFAFCDHKPTALIVPPKTSVLVRGWPITFEKTNEFLVTAYADSAAFQLKTFARVGVIHAAFAAAWPTGSPPPLDEPTVAAKGSRSITDATGHGTQVKEKIVAVERNVGVLRASISVRYTR